MLIGPFEHGKRPAQVALAEGQETDPLRGKHEACGVRHRLGNPQSFFPEGTALSERAQLGMARGEAGTGEHSGQDKLTEALVAPRPLEECHGLPEAVNRPTIVALGTGRPGRGSWFACACRTTSPPAVASARAHWPAITAWSYAPMR